MNLSLNFSNSSRLRVVAIAAGGFGLAVTPFLMAAWQAESDSYMLIGRMYFPIYIGALAGMLLFRRRLRAKPAFWGRLGFWLAFGALCLGLVGDIGAFWSDGNNFAITPATRSQSAFFYLDLLSVALAQFGILYYGLGLVWSEIVPVRTGWTMTALAFVGFPLSIVHIPSGTMFAITVFWVVSAIRASTAEPVAAQAPGRPAPGDKASPEHN